MQLDGRNRQAYDPDEVEEEQRERERRNKINVEFQRFTKRVQDHWDREMPRLNLEWDSPYRCALFLLGCLVGRVLYMYSVLKCRNVMHE